jgi:argininosuccinate lyase
MPTLWDGRFDSLPDETMRNLSDSLKFDQRLFKDDIAASRAHVKMLVEQGVITADAGTEIIGALDQVESEIDEGILEYQSSDEDIHTAVERRVTEITGAGQRMHTGRSRNDQVATDVRLYTRRAIDEISALVGDLQETLIGIAEQAGHSVLPAYTHLQRAQPVTLAHFLLSHGWALQRDVARLADARSRVNISTLGAGAIAGTSLPIDVESTAAELGFDSAFTNSIDAVEDRDFVAEVLFALALLGVHLSRLSEDIVIWCSTEFGYITLDDRFSTGSSMMPQKKNPDAAELARGKAGRLIGNLTSMLVTLKGLPSGYNKDLQEDKHPLFDSIDTLKQTLPALTGTLGTATFNTEKMAEAASDPLLVATDIAEWLVAEGMPFREAHGIVGNLVKRSLAGEGKLVDLVSEAPELGPEAASLFSGPPGHLRTSPGSGSPDQIAGEIAQLRAEIGDR